MSDVMRVEQAGNGYVSGAAPLPAVRLPGVGDTSGGGGINIRLAVQGDFAWIDDLQKRHKHGVGFMWEKAIRGHITKGNVLVAEATRDVRCSMGDAPSAMCDVGCSMSEAALSDRTSNIADRTCAPIAHRVGYVLGTDRYLKRDELGIIYQMNVEPAYQRSLVAAHLLKAKFERSAYGCRLYCCWCAQDLPANRFWEAMGFVPLAFRTGGGRGKTKKDGKFRGRMHIFWQKRIRQGDYGPGDARSGGGGTAYWFPSMTGAGAIGEDRMVLPIPPGTHWSDAKPVVLPEGLRSGGGTGGEEVKQLESEVQQLERERRRGQGVKQVVKAALPAVASKAIAMGGLRFGPSPAALQVEKQKEQEAEAAAQAVALKEKKKAVKRAKQKFDPAQEAFARELKDRWLEEVQAQPGLIAATQEKYDVTRRIGVRGASMARGEGAGVLAGDEGLMEGGTLRITEGARRAEVVEGVTWDEVSDAA